MKKIKKIKKIDFPRFLILVVPPSFLQDIRQFLFSQGSQVRMFLNVGLHLTVYSSLLKS